MSWKLKLHEVCEAYWKGREAEEKQLSELRDQREKFVRKDSLSGRF